MPRAGLKQCRLANWFLVTERILSFANMLNETDPLFFCRAMVALRKPARLRGRYYKPDDGIWKVETGKGILGAFLVRGGRVIRCGPRIRRKLHWWAARNGKFVGSIEHCLTS